MDNMLKYTIFTFIMSLFTWSVSHNLITGEEDEIVNKINEEEEDFSRGTNNPIYAELARNYKKT